MKNPYASHLGDRDPIAVIAATAAELRQLAAKLGPAVERPLAPGKWSPRQIFAHLADCEIAFGFRLRQALAEDAHVMQPFDQDRWARQYGAYSADAALAAFEALRNWNVALIRSLPEAAFARPVTHPERGTGTFQVLVDTMGGHDRNHLQQLEAAAGV